MALGEEFHRQRHHMPEKAADHDHRQLGLQPQQQRLAQHRQDGAEQRGHRHADQQRHEPAGGVLDQDIVDEDFGKSRGDDAGTTSARLTTTSKPDRRPSSRVIRAAAAASPAACCPSFLNDSGALHGEHDAGERKIEFGHVDPPASDARVVDVDAIAVDAFQHDEMVEVPVDDAGHRQFVQLAAPCGSPWLQARSGAPP